MNSRFPTRRSGREPAAAAGTRRSSRVHWMLLALCAAPTSGFDRSDPARPLYAAAIGFGRIEVEQPVTAVGAHPTQFERAPE
jgi:hypothetical protein